MEYVSDISEVSFESSFKWTVNNLSAANNNKNYFIKSKEIQFKEANATWYLKLKLFVYSSTEKLLGVSFFLVDDGRDENARYKFSLKMSDGSGEESPFIVKNETKRSHLLEYKLGKYMSLGEGVESITLEPVCIMETLKQDSEIYDDDFELLNDNIAIIASTPEKEKPVKDEVSCDEMPEVTEEKDNAVDSESASDENSDDDLESSGSVECESDTTYNAEEKCDNARVTRKIQKIYLIKMRQIAETSARMLVTAARVSQRTLSPFDLSINDDLFYFQQNEFNQLLAETCKSFAAQITPTTFLQVWEIANELKAEPLKKHVIDYIAQNRDRLNYDSRMPSDLMLEVVRAVK